MNEQYIESLLDELRNNPPESLKYRQAMEALNGVRTKNYKEIDDETL